MNVINTEHTVSTSCVYATDHYYFYMQNLLCSPSCHTVPNIFYTPLSNLNLTLMFLCSSTGCKSDLEQNPSTAPSPLRPGVIWPHVGFRQVLMAYCSPFSCSAHPTVSFAGTHLSLLELCLPTRVLLYKNKTPSLLTVS